MPELGNVIIGIKAVDEASSVLDKVRASTSLLGSVFQSFGGAVGAAGDVLQGFAAGGVAGAAIGALGAITKGLEWSVKEATDSEQAFKNLSTAVERSGTAWSTVEASTKQYLDQLQRSTTYSDEALAGMVERLLTFGLSYEQAMKAAGAALDLAAAKHMDLESAATLVGKAVDGNTAVLKRYGVDVEVAKDATDKFTPVIAALNEQFGGAAQEQAKTYAGIQERLKNATSELGEKIGGILLPGLASVTEAMIPVVDWFGKSVDSIQAWLTEVGKMPEVQGIMTAVNEAFSGFWSYLQNLWAFIQESFGPALKELWQAFKDLWDALSPIGEAIGEIINAITGGQSDFDLFKTIIQGIVLEIRGIAATIKEVAPYIKQFADAFKAAADFIAPILTQIKDAIVGFINALKDAFQGFYNWLVGGSLWTDMWKQILSIAGQMISTLLGDLGTKLFEPMKSAFLTATQAVEQTWQASWQTIQTTFNTVTSAIQTSLNTRFEQMKAFVTANLGEYAPIASNALSAMQAAMNAVMDLIHGDWQGFLDNMSNAMNLFWSAIQGATAAAFTQLQASFTGAMSTIQGILSGAINAMQGMWTGFANFMSGAIAAFESAVSGAASFLSSTLAGMQSAASSALASIQGMISSAWSSVTSAASSMASSITGAATQASTAVSTITAPLTETMPASTLSPNIIGAQINEPGYRTTTTTKPTTVSVTTPVTVTLDSQTISKTVQKSIVSSIDYRGKR